MKKSSVAKSPTSSRSRGLASDATERRRGANSPSANTQGTRGSAPKASEHDRASKPERRAAARGSGTKSGGSH